MMQIDLINYCGIYEIKNNFNNKTYVGSGKSVRKRLHAHISTLRSNCHRNNHLQAAWNKYGENNFSFQKIEDCSEERLIEREQFWIDATQQFSECGENLTGYNILPIAGRPLNHNWPKSSVELLLYKNKLKAIKRLENILERYTSETIPRIQNPQETLQEQKDREWINRYYCAKNGTNKVKWIPELEIIAKSHGFDLFVSCCHAKTIRRLKHLITYWNGKKLSLLSKDAKERSDARFLRGLLDAKRGCGKYRLNEEIVKLLDEIKTAQSF